MSIPESVGITISKLKATEAKRIKRISQRLTHS